MVLEILHCLVCLLGPLELVMVLEQFEEGWSPFSKSGDELIQSCHAACELLDVLDHPWSIHGCDAGNLLWVCFNSSMTNNEPEYFSLWHAKDALCWVNLPSKLPQVVESFLEISDELIMGSCLDDHIIHVSFNDPV
jgi:hypothetical protein